ncbi:MAG: Crp/Fnr family transcriptional regulator [Hyphomicrobiaceae bacterium]
MALDLIAARLSRLDLFRGMTSSQLQRLAQDAGRMIFRDGQKLVVAGQEGEGAIVIISGRAVILPDPELGIEEQDVEVGSMLGEGAMLAEHTFRLTVAAVGDVRAVQLTREALHAHIQDDPEFADDLRERLANRLQRVAIELRLIDERLAIASQMNTPEAETA